MRFPHRVNGEVRLLRRRRRSRCGCAGVGGSAAWREEQRDGEERNGEQAHEMDLSSGEGRSFVRSGESWLPASRERRGT